MDLPDSPEHQFDMVRLGIGLYGIGVPTNLVIRIRSGAFIKSQDYSMQASKKRGILLATVAWGKSK